MTKQVIGILAHVDAGKTTLSEALLYECGAIRKWGRVDHGDTSLDYDSKERARGITIYTKEARFTYKDLEYILVDTPGHVDFSTEMERTLQILDAAILVISGTEGIQSHTRLIWDLLKHYQVPVFIFVNKMDISHYTKEQLICSMQEQLSEGCLDFDQANFFEEASLLNEQSLNYYLEYNKLSTNIIQDLIKERSLFPIHFGSALKKQGILPLLDSMSKYHPTTNYKESFQAIVFRKSMEQGQRFTHIKLTGGNLKVKSTLENGEKVDQIRLYNANKYEMVDCVEAGDICALKGIHNFPIGTILELARKNNQRLSSYLTYKIEILDQSDPYLLYQKLLQLNEEDPELHLKYNATLKEIHISLMGEIQCEILKQTIQERYAVQIALTSPEIAYKETIVSAVEGVGHFEPLRHYAEVHLWLEPLPSGSGLLFACDVPKDTLEPHWQNLILAYLDQREHRGVLTNSPLTDMKITLIHGKSHLKHTEGGDMREACYRALRQGLMETESVLLEPYYAYTLRIPSHAVSKAIYDIELMQGTYEIQQQDSEFICLKGEAPVRFMQDYPQKVASYTKGEGQFSCEFACYKPCIKQEEIIKEKNYQADADIENPSSSVFCSQGSGYYVKWNEVKEHAHLPLRQIKPKVSVSAPRKIQISEEELQRVYERTFGPTSTKLYHATIHKEEHHEKIDTSYKTPCLLVDGYNVLFGWDDLKEMAKEDLQMARLELIQRMCNYQGYKNMLLILVFDAYKVKDNVGSIIKHDNIHIVYTKEAQTADSYIEKVTHDLKHQYAISVITSDGMEQLIIMGNQARRIPVRELIYEYEYLSKEFHKNYNEATQKSFNHSLAKIRALNNKES